MSKLYISGKPERALNTKVTVHYDWYIGGGGNPLAYKLLGEAPVIFDKDKAIEVLSNAEQSDKIKEIMKLLCP